MRLRAKVTKSNAPSTNFVGTIVGGKPVPTKRLPDPVWLEISGEEDAFFLLYINADGECFADTWHKTLDSAQREAMLGFGITASEWVKVENGE